MRRRRPVAAAHERGAGSVGNVRGVRERPLVHLVIPRWGGTGLHQTFGHRMPPMALLVLAAHARRAGWDARVIDQNYERIPDEIPDLACLTVWTMMAPQAYRIADAYRAQGVPVVLGGVHPSLLPSEALRHAHAVVSGEADTVFATVLHDAAANHLQRLYKGSFQSMDDVPMNHEWADIIKSFPITRYAPLNTLQTTRGCRFNCDFCSVIRINGRGSRHSPTDRVIEEIKVLKRIGQHVGEWAYVFFLDDDLAADLDFCGELSEAILSSGVKVRWGAQASIGLARNPKLLDLATRSGLRTMFVGFEGIDRESLLEAQQEEPPVGVRRARGPRPQIRRRHRGRLHLRLRQPGPRLLRGDRHLRRPHRRRRGPLLDPHALPGHRHLRPHAPRRAHHQLRLEALQHVLLRLPAGPHDGRPARGRPGHRLPHLLLPQAPT